MHLDLKKCTKYLEGIWFQRSNKVTRDAEHGMYVGTQPWIKQPDYLNKLPIDNKDIWRMVCFVLYSYFNLRSRIKASSLQDKIEGEYGILMNSYQLLAYAWSFDP